MNPISTSRIEDPDLLLIAKSLERIGDHCTNIAKRVEFSVTGVHKDCRLDVKSM